MGQMTISGSGTPTLTSATAFDGDVAYCLAAGALEADPVAVAALGAEMTAAAIRDAVRNATGAPGCPAASERR